MRDLWRHPFPVLWFLTSSYILLSLRTSRGNKEPWETLTLTPPGHPESSQVASHSPALPQQLLFLSSLPRCSSSFIAKVFSAGLPGAVSLFESMAFLEMDLFNTTLGSREVVSKLLDVLRLPCNAVQQLLRRLPHTKAHLLETILDFNRPNFSSCSNRHWTVVKEVGYLSGHLALLRERGLRSLYYVRDPRAWVSSLIWRGIDGTSLYEQWAWNATEFLVPPACYHLLSSSVLPLLDLHRPPHVRAAARWLIDVRCNIFDGGMEYLKVEELWLSPNRTLRRIWSQLQLPTPGFDDALKYLLSNTLRGAAEERFSLNRDVRSMVNIWRERLTPSEVIEIEEVVGQEMIMLGYQGTQRL